MKSSPTPEGQGQKPTADNSAQPVLRKKMRWALVLVVALFSLFFINSQFPVTPQGDLQPPFDAQVLSKFNKPKGSAGHVIYVPNDDGQLRRVTIKDTLPPASTTNASQAYMTNAAFAMKHLLQEAPAEFPAGTRLLAVKVDQGKKTVSVDLSKEFTTSSFWQGSTRTLATVYAVVNTLAAVNPTVANKVQFLVEGKPADLLGEFDASEPLEPDNKLVTSS